MSIIKDSVKAVIANKEHYNNVDTFARTAFNKYCDDNPKQEGTWRGYKNFQVFDENYIRINYEFGGGDMEFDSCIFIDLNTKKITETYEPSTK
jgi:hypothetical protein